MSPASATTLSDTVMRAAPDLSGASPIIARVLKGELCTGCGLCAGVADGAVAMTTVAPGYSRPVVQQALTAQTEQAIASACPGNKVAPWQPAPHQHVSWGPWLQTLTGYAVDPEVRYCASSGGAISALLIHALEIGLVDAALHITADPDRPTRNLVTWSRTREEVISAAGSRYAASSPLAEINAALSQDLRVAFVGKPCDVSALRQLATVDPRVNERFPLMLSFFCAGLSSHDGADRIIRDMGFEPDEVKAFRYRGNGWPGMTRAETHDGRVGEMRYEDSWGGQLSKEVQFRCKICPDAVGGVADIACADAWYGGETGYPQFEEQDGRSLIMSRTLIGDKLLREAMQAGKIAATVLPINEIDLMQPGQARRKRLVAARLAACAATLQPRPTMTGLDVGRAARQAGLVETVKNWLGTMRRIVQGRR
jgi:coenzyme F420 hydrogenase subunit beta